METNALAASRLAQRLKAQVEEFTRVNASLRDRNAVLEREVLVQATPTASSVASEAGSGPAFVQAIRLVTVAPSAKVPAFGPNAELE